MAKAIKYASYEEWVYGRISRCKTKMMSTASLMKLPKYLKDIEVEPTEYELEKRLRALRDTGRLAAINKRWYLRRAPA